MDTNKIKTVGIPVAIGFLVVSLTLAFLKNRFGIEIGDPIELETGDPDINEIGDPDLQES
jgi:hypothetical protein